MKWKNRLTNYNFWISIVSAVLLILQAFEINFDIAYINEIATAVLGLLVVIGIISDPTKSAIGSNTVKEEKAEVETKPNPEQKVEEDEVEEKDQIVEEQIIPINAENANNTINIQDDFKVLIEEIRKDIEAMTEKMSSLKPQVRTEPVQESSYDTPIVNETTFDQVLEETLIMSAVEKNKDEAVDAPIQTSYSIVN